MIANREEVEKVYGDWPLFHDSKIISAEMFGDACEVVIHAFQMTDMVDDDGFVILSKHHLVKIRMSDVLECSLPSDYEGDTLFSLEIKESNRTNSVEFKSVTGQDWGLVCRNVSVTGIEPCSSNGEPL